jgi:hypothetical protein
MNIIFGTNEAEKLSEKYTLLELDTITIGNSNPITTYCVIDGVPVENFPNIVDYKQLHNDLIANYRKRDWTYCLKAIEKLTGFWGSDVDTFYEVLATRITDYSVNEPDDSWNGIVQK